MAFERQLRLHDLSTSYHPQPYSHNTSYSRSASPTSPYSDAYDSEDSAMDDASNYASPCSSSSYSSPHTSKDPRRSTKKNARAVFFPELGEFLNEGEAGPNRPVARRATQTRRASGSLSPYDKDDRNARKRKVSSRSIKSEKKLTKLARQKLTLQAEMKQLEEQLQRAEEFEMAVEEEAPSRSTPLKIKCPGGRSVNFLTLQLGNYSLERSDDEDEEMQDDGELVRMVPYPRSDEYESGEESPVYEKRSVFRVGRA